ncbi:hypothetical protein SprV_0301075500 [Sparganum proliferum]
MVSFDVVSLFTSIPLDLAKQCTEDLLQSCDTDVPAIALLELLDLCMETNFSFDQQYYQQMKGAPMGSPISGFLAEITMQKLEATALPLVNPKLWLRYVDDTFVIVKKDQLETLHNAINSTMPGIKFTLEKEVDKELPFLDVLVQRKTDGTLRTSVYRKQTYAEVILHYESNHPISHKRGETTNVIYRIRCNSCEVNYIGETGKRLQTRVGERMRAVRRMDPLSLVAEHCADAGNTFAFQHAEILGRGNDRIARETIEAWHTGTTSINRCVALPAAYQALRAQLSKQMSRRAPRLNTNPDMSESMADTRSPPLNRVPTKAQSSPQPVHLLVRRTRKRTVVAA